MAATPRLSGAMTRLFERGLAALGAFEMMLALLLILLNGLGLAVGACLSAACHGFMIGLFFFISGYRTIEADSQVSDGVHKNGTAAGLGLLGLAISVLASGVDAHRYIYYNQPPWPTTINIMLAVVFAVGGAVAIYGRNIFAIYTIGKGIVQFVIRLIPTRKSTRLE